jgi:hypothetical protein
MRRFARSRRCGVQCKSLMKFDQTLPFPDFIKLAGALFISDTRA